jgi:Amidohydrolase family
VFALRANRAFDGEDFRPGGATLLLENGRIIGVEPAVYQPPSDCELVDYGNATVMPGLIDVHVHLVGDSEVMALERVPEYSPEEIDSVVTDALRRQLAAGVTTVRDLGDWHFNVVERRDAQRRVDDGCPGSLPLVRRLPVWVATVACTPRLSWPSPDDASTCSGRCSATTVPTKKNRPNTCSPLDKPD